MRVHILIVIVSSLSSFETLRIPEIGDPLNFVGDFTVNAHLTVAETTTEINAVDDLTTVTGTDLPVTEAEILFLEFDYEFLSREEFWSDNHYECHNGTLVPSAYLRRKYGECEKIHHTVNPLCTKNCQMAITLLLGEKRIPNREYFQQYFKEVLPENLRDSAILHYEKCFDTFGQSEEDFLDWSCEGPQPFYACMVEFEKLMIC